MEAARSAFHTQLAAVMDSLLAAAVCEIAKIFESSLCEQQAELTQKSQEISVLRCKLDKVERRQKAKGGGAGGGEEGELSSGDPDVKIQTLTGAGQSAEKDASAQSDPAEGVSKLKEEITSEDGAAVKHERVGSRPNQSPFTVQTSEERLSLGNHRQIDALSGIQAKNKLSHWEENSRSADLRPPQDQASPPFLSISQTGRCSPRPDPSLAHPAEWLPGLDSSRAGVSTLDNMQEDGTTCSGPTRSGTSGDPPCFRPAFVSDETSNEGDDSAFPFLDQEENQNSNQNSVVGQGVGHGGGPPDQPQASSTEWRTRDERNGRGSVSHTRRLANFSSRDPLRIQSNSPSLTLRHSITLSHPAASGGGSGRPYTCPYCTKCFTYPSHQRRHLLRHTGVRLHPCQFCEKSFLTPSELTVHTRTHTGERPFGCAQCGKRFARSGNLRAHQRDVHMGKRPFACTECGKRFAHRGNLRVHNHRVHQGDPYYMEDQPEPDIAPNPI